MTKIKCLERLDSVRSGSRVVFNLHPPAEHVFENASSKPIGVVPAAIIFSKKEIRDRSHLHERLFTPCGGSQGCRPCGRSQHLPWLEQRTPGEPDAGKDRPTGKLTMVSFLLSSRVLQCFISSSSAYIASSLRARYSRRPWAHPATSVRHVTMLCEIQT